LFRCSSCDALGTERVVLVWAALEGSGVAGIFELLLAMEVDDLPLVADAADTDIIGIEGN
jgi:hypothetical protein